jgi:lysophospholipid acyltransferase (LPLAT)-like uncharacterized protein
MKRGPLKTLRKKIVASLGPSLAYWTIRILGATMRFKEVNSEIPRSFIEKGTLAIGAFWHGRLLMMPCLESVHKETGRKMSFLVSAHRDGQVIGKAVQKFGHRAILGSSTRRGFSAFHQMLKAQKDGYDVIFVPDGPKGPRQQVQIGIIELARLSRCPIVPLSFSASRRKIFNTWDRFLLPCPFSKGVFIWGEPVYIDPDGDRTHLEEQRLLLEQRLNQLTERADRYFEKPSAS